MRVAWWAFVLPALVLAGSVFAQESGPFSDTGQQSSRLARLAKDAAARGSAAVEEFWAEMTRDHTPLIEQVPGDPTRVLLTFPWRTTDRQPDVQVLAHDLTHLSGTDVWYFTVTMRRDHRLSYRFMPREGAPATQLPQADPFNPHRFEPPVDAERPPSAINADSPYVSSSIVVVPGVPVSPYVDVRPNVARGRVEVFTYPSRIYAAPRRAWIYTPPRPAAGGRPAGLLICLWGRDYLNEIPVPTILDNLIADGKLPPIAAVFVDSGDDRFQDFQSTQKFTQSFATELMPALHTRLGTAFDPAHTVLTGYSAAGLESGYIAYAHPELVARVLTQSGAFWRAFEGSGASEPEWLTGRFLAAPPRPTRFVLDVGGEETRAPAGGATFKEAVAHLRDALVHKGYAVSYVEVSGGEHEFIHWRTTFADDLLWLTSDW